MIKLGVITSHRYGVHVYEAVFVRCLYSRWTRTSTQTLLVLYAYRARTEPLTTLPLLFPYFQYSYCSPTVLSPYTQRASSSHKAVMHSSVGHRQVPRLGDSTMDSTVLPTTTMPCHVHALLQVDRLVGPANSFGRPRCLKHCALGPAQCFVVLQCSSLTAAVELQAQSLFNRRFGDQTYSGNPSTKPAGLRV